MASSCASSANSRSPRRRRSFHGSIRWAVDHGEPHFHTPSLHTSCSLFEFVAAFRLTPLSLAVLHRGHQRERLRWPMGAACAHQRSSGGYPSPPWFLIALNLPSPGNFSGLFLHLLGCHELGLTICGKQRVGSIVSHLTKLFCNCSVKPKAIVERSCCASQSSPLLFGVQDRVKSRKFQD